MPSRRAGRLVIWGPMETLTGGRLVARMLRKEGVSTVFTLSGSGSEWF